MLNLLLKEYCTGALALLQTESAWHDGWTPLLLTIGSRKRERPFYTQAGVRSSGQAVGAKGTVLTVSLQTNRNQRVTVRLTGIIEVASQRTGLQDRKAEVLVAKAISSTPVIGLAAIDPIIGGE